MVWSKQNTNVYSVSEPVQPLGCDALFFLRIISISWLLSSMCRSPPCRQLPFMYESFIYLFIFKCIPSEGGTKDKNLTPCHGGKQWWEHRETPRVNPVPEYSSCLGAFWRLSMQPWSLPASALLAYFLTICYVSQWNKGPDLCKSSKS